MSIRHTVCRLCCTAFDAVALNDRVSRKSSFLWLGDVAIAAMAMMQDESF